jgi:hypothetical protein
LVFADCPTVDVDLPTAVLLAFAVLPWPEFDTALYVDPLRVTTVVLLWALIVWPMLLRLLFVFGADWVAADVDLAALVPLLLIVLKLRPLLLLRPWAFVAELLAVPITLPIRELFAELTRGVVLEADRPAVLERTSTVLRTFEDLLEDVTRELRFDERLGVDLLTRVLVLGLLERAVLDRPLLELLLLETDELRPAVRDEDDCE